MCLSLMPRRAGTQLAASSGDKNTHNIRYRSLHGPSRRCAPLGRETFPITISTFNVPRSDLARNCTPISRAINNEGMVFEIPMHKPVLPAYLLHFSLANKSWRFLFTARVTDSLISLFISPLSVSIGHSSHANVRVAIFFSDEAAQGAKERAIEGGVSFHKFPVICAPFLDCPFATKYTVRGTTMKMVL